MSEADVTTSGTDAGTLGVHVTTSGVDAGTLGTKPGTTETYANTSGVSMNTSETNTTTPNADTHAIATDSRETVPPMSGALEGVGGVGGVGGVARHDRCRTTQGPKTHRTIQCLFTAILPTLFASNLQAQHVRSVYLLETDFSGPWTVLASSSGTGTRLSTGGCPGGPFWRTTLQVQRPSCAVGASRDYVFLLRQTTWYDPAVIGPITRFDSQVVGPRVLNQANSSFSIVSSGILVEQGGYLFGVGTFRLPFARSGACEPCNGGCGDGPIPPSTLIRLPDGLPGGPSRPDFSQSGAPFRVGFYTALDMNGCTLSPVAATVDIDGWELSMWSCPPPTFSSHPSDITNACRGGDVIFHATTTGVPRWRRNGVPLSDLAGRITGSGTNTLTIRSITALDAGTYDCTASGPCNAPYGTTYRVSNPATLTICVADTDDGSGTGTCDGGVGIEDLLYYLTVYDAGTSRADVDDGTATGHPDGGVGIEDLLYYLTRYDGGC